MNGTMTLPKMDGFEIRPGVRLIGEPTPIPGTDTMRCLANLDGMLVVLELGIKFRAQSVDGKP